MANLRSVTALEVLRRCSHPEGFVASPEPRTNYRRVWSRDGCICGLAAVEAGDPELVETFRRTLRTLAGRLGSAGQAPSNVALPGPERAVGGAVEVSYGTLAGRVDATLWFIVGACVLDRVVGGELLDELWPALERMEALLVAWELNDGGLLYVPQTGDWADEYLLSGYLLYDQVLRAWALSEWRGAAERRGRERPGAQERIERIHHLLATRFGPVPDRPYFLAGDFPGGRFEMLDAFGNALTCLVGVGDIDARRLTLASLEDVAQRGLVPAFHPVIEEDDPRYAELVSIARGRVRNRPGRYHNGGLWPMVTGFVALAARGMGRRALADELAAGIEAANRLGGGGFYEYHDARTGEPGGARHQAWSAAAEIIARAERITPLPASGG